MENRALFAIEANRRFVQERLDRRRLEKQLDAFEYEMIQRVNKNCEDSAWQRKFDMDADFVREASNIRIAERAERKRLAQQKRKDTALGILAYFAYAVFMAWLPRNSYFPVYMAALLIVGGFMFLAIYLCRVHGLLPTEGEE